MSELPKRLSATVGERGLLRAGACVLVAVSGGVDSMVLLYLLHGLSKSNQWRLRVAHFNHHLRGRSSAADERLVRSTAAKLRLSLVVGRANVRALARIGGVSLEMAARAARHDFLARTAARLKISTVALAHHADDQVELFFLRLFRGSGGEGLAGMKWRSPSPSRPDIEIVRPLLGTPKSDLVDYARVVGIPFREDATNRGLDQQRNRIRNELLPLLRSKYQPAINRTIARLMEITGTEANYVSEAARAWLQNSTRSSFDKLPVALQRRCVQLNLIEQGVNLDYELIEHLRLHPGQPAIVSSQIQSAPAALAKIRRHPPAETRSVSVLRHASGAVQVQPLSSAEFNPAATELALTVSRGNSRFDGAHFRWSLHSAQKPRPARQLLPMKAKPGIEHFDADKVGPRITLRHWRPGDRFQPIGMKNAVKLQDLFVNQKVPRASRHHLIVATAAAGELFWVEGLRIGENFKLTATTNRRLQWHWQRP